MQPIITFFEPLLDTRNLVPEMLGELQDRHRHIG
jgi:hypothetical protein